MAVLARSDLVRRLVGAVRRGRTPIVLGGPGTGKTTVARAAAAQLAPGVGVIELPDHKALDLEALEELDRRCVLVGELELHRSLEARGRACRIAGRTVQRFPLVPLTRRQSLTWMQAIGGRPLPVNEFELLFRATGGHPSLVAAWVEKQARGVTVGALPDALVGALEPLLARIDHALGHPELAVLYEWLDQNGPARIAALQSATGAPKGSIDRLVLAGPVARTLAPAAEIAIGCDLYRRHRNPRSRS